ncbi:hypothetical protein GCM10011581_34220 [Saccharopolyspora subtropica]|uniref:Uncharacterized protein n=1 Tax=Saccharopolyspora thermophila TaxID=89367 RepID=A0A917NEX9_9PSEU|nr:hypothetical protein [Saccharopolyspora subtropica]GGI94258.1 hypothetical protein GCM10011581_34220 [Saccharopolyspora subtropica]
MELQDVARELYGTDPADFVSERDRQAAAARDSGDEELAASIRKLRKPTTAAWAVNLLAAHEPRGLDELLDLGDRMRAAQRELRGDELRTLAADRTRLLRALTDRAADLARERGHPLADAVRDQVEQTLTAALSEPEAGQAVRAGTLAKPLTYSGFGLDELSLVAVRRSATTAPARAERDRRATVEAGARTAERERRVQRDRERRANEKRERDERSAVVRELRTRLKCSDQQLGEAADAVEKIERAQREAEQRRARLRAELEQVDDELRELRRQAKAARQSQERAQRDREAVAERLKRADVRKR